MATNFFIRTSKTEGTATVFARVQCKSPKLDIRVSTFIEENIQKWGKLKDADAKKRFDKTPTGILLKEIEQKLDSIIAEGLTAETVQQQIKEIVYKRELEEERIRKEETEAARQMEEDAAKAKTLEQFTEQYIAEAESGYHRHEDTKQPLSAGTIKSYRGFLAQVREYQKAKRVIVRLNDVTIDFHNQFMQFLERKNYSPNTIGRHIKICKTMVRAAKERNLTDGGDVNQRAFKAAYVDVDNVYLTEQRIQELYDLDLSNRPAWDKYRDIFVIGCLTGQRVSDYKRITLEDIVIGKEGIKLIKIAQQKTGNTVYSPLDRRVEAILQKYDGVLPKVFDQKLNYAIKEIAEFLDWTELVSVDSQKGSLKVSKKMRFCDMVKTHTARRSFCTNAYEAGATIAEIMAVSGHCSEDQLRTYLKLGGKQKGEMAAKSAYFLNKLSKAE